MHEAATLYDPSAHADALRPPRLPEIDDAPFSDARLVGRPERQLRPDVHRMGMCVAVVADGVFFASLLAVSLIVRSVHPEIFGYGRYFLDARFGVVESSVLLSSALLGTLTIRLAIDGARGRFAVACVATLAFGVAFLALVGHEASGLAARGLLPGSHFTSSEPVWRTPEFRREHAEAARYADAFRAASPIQPGARRAHAVPHEPTAAQSEPLVTAGVLGERAILAEVPSQPRNAHLFFGLFCLVTALQALHAVAGLVVWAVLLLRARRKIPAIAAADSASLYWNLVTLMRIALCPLFYFMQ